MSSSRFNNVDMLRGIAALCVTYFHLSGSAGLSNAIARTGSLGYLGVQIFFVISGFIIPTSMMRNEYTIKKIHLFLVKRILRLDPPYLISISIVILFAMLSSRELPTSFELLLHLAKLNSLMGENWASPVYWTLAVEFQFIILISIFYGLVSSKQIGWYVFSSLALLMCCLFSSANFIFHYIPFFMIGIAVFRRVIMDGSSVELVISLLFNFIICFFTNGQNEALTALFSSFFILFYKPTVNRITECILYLGKISYSLYLIHWTIGITVINVLRHIPELQSCEVIRLVLGLGCSIFFSDLFFKFIETPVLHFSQKISLKW